MLVALLDGYIDEPSSLGVPPFISPMVRYLAGAIIDSGHQVMYRTIDAYRTSPKIRAELSGTNMLVIAAGVTVPGRYIRGSPMSPKESLEIARCYKGVKVVAGFMAGHLSQDEPAAQMFDMVLKGTDPDAQLFDALKGGLCAGPVDRKRSDEEWNRWAVKGASVVGSHPDFPQPLIAEIDVYKGCVRFCTGGCSFCSEILLGHPRFREPEDIASEIQVLDQLGVTNYRLACPCMISYKADDIEKKDAVPVPEEVDNLLNSVTQAAENMRVLHVDNADPGIIARHPEESIQALTSIVRYCTSGNILSLGMESADPAVIEANNLNSTPKQVLEAIKYINRIGGERGPTGLPYLLPGLNFIAGLKGESSKTYKLDLEFLKEVLDENLIVRRINIRQVMEHRAKFPGVKKRKDFMRFKEAVRFQIDRPMLERLLPKGTVLRDIYVENIEGNLAFARQVGTYPILVGVPGPYDVKGFFDAAIVDWGQRSVTALPYPLDINKANLVLLSALPGIGKKRAARLVRARPFKCMEDVSKALDDPHLIEGLRPFVSLP